MALASRQDHRDWLTPALGMQMQLVREATLAPPLIGVMEKLPHFPLIRSRPWNADTKINQSKSDLPSTQNFE